MLDLKSNQRNNWIGFALAHHLRGEYAEAAKVLKVYEDTETTVRAYLRPSLRLNVPFAGCADSRCGHRTRTPVLRKTTRKAKC